jgi:hypothetical protein
MVELRELRPLWITTRRGRIQASPTATTLDTSKDSPS